MQTFQDALKAYARRKDKDLRTLVRYAKLFRVEKILRQYLEVDVYKRQRTRFSKFFNLPELMNLFKEVADIKTADQLHLPTPQRCV